MVIKASSVFMDSQRDYTREARREVAEAVVRSDTAASVSISAEGRKQSQTITDGSVARLSNKEDETYRDASGRSLEDIRKRLGQDKENSNPNELQMRLNDAVMEAEALSEKQLKQEKDAENRLWMRRMGTGSVTPQGNILGKQLNFVQMQDEFEAELIKKLMESLRKMMYGEDDEEETDKSSAKSMGDLFAWDFSAQNSFSASFGFGVNNAGGSMATGVSVSGMEGVRASGVVGRAGTTVTVPGWTKITAASNFVKETENTHFLSQGFAQTADGRNLSFNIDLEMSRAFEEETFSYKEEAFRLVDPLVINLESNAASLSDRKYYFDLDADGTEEEISFAAKGSGFLAYDKNGDGIINDGSELFGTRSGDGFKDLAQYDSDGNGWIDEADDIFKHLKVWTKNADGSDRLLTLKEADVGAIYLGNADTQFTLRSDVSGDAQGLIRKSGVYLKESGGAGTVQHVDLVL